MSAVDGVSCCVCNIDKPDPSFKFRTCGSSCEDFIIEEKLKLKKLNDMSDGTYNNTRCQECGEMMDGFASVSGFYCSPKCRSDVWKRQNKPRKTIPKAEGKRGLTLRAQIEDHLGVKRVRGKSVLVPKKKAKSPGRKKGSKNKPKLKEIPKPQVRPYRLVRHIREEEKRIIRMTKSERLKEIARLNEYVQVLSSDKKRISWEIDSKTMFEIKELYRMWNDLEGKGQGRIEVAVKRPT